MVGIAAVLMDAVAIDVVAVVVVTTGVVTAAATAAAVMVVSTAGAAFAMLAAMVAATVQLAAVCAICKQVTSQVDGFDTIDDYVLGNAVAADGYLVCGVLRRTNLDVLSVGARAPCIGDRATLVAPRCEIRAVLHVSSACQTFVECLAKIGSVRRCCFPAAHGGVHHQVLIGALGGIPGPVPVAVLSPKNRL